MSLFSIHVVTHICHCSVFLFGGLRYPYGPDDGGCTSRKYSHSTRTHVNRQTEKECAWGRPRLLQTVFKMLFLRSFVTCHKRAAAWLFHIGARQNYCVCHLSSRRSDGGLTVMCLVFRTNLIRLQVQRGTHLRSSVSTADYVFMQSKCQAHAVVYSA